MSRFARVGEEAFERNEELTREEFFLYALICLHSVSDEASGGRICRKSIDELCEMHNLDYFNTMRRCRRMRTGKFSKREKPKKVEKMKSPWLKKVRSGIIPLVGFITTEEPDFEEAVKPQKKAQKTSNENNGHRSIFSIEEIRKYIAVCQRRGDAIYNPAGLAMNLYETGKADAFIQYELYPETPETTSIADDGLPVLDEQGRLKALELLEEMIDDGFKINDWERYYSEDDWQWLMQELETTRTGMS